LQRALALDPRVHAVSPRHFNTSDFYLEAYPTLPPDRVVVESDETLVKGDDTFSSVHITLARIRDAVPDAQILLTIREQRDLLVSAFKHGLRVGLPEATLEEFLLSPRGADFISFTRYATLLQLIGLHFPARQVHVIPFEWLRDDPVRFYDRVYDVLGLKPPADPDIPPENTSPDPAQLEALGQLAELRRPGTARAWPELLVRGVRVLGAATDDATGGRLARLARYRLRWTRSPLCTALDEEHREQNRQLADQTGLDLASLGYLT
jgi:hypothetical protein